MAPEADPCPDGGPDALRSELGDRSALAGLLARHLPLLERYAARRLVTGLRHRVSPADIVQSACREVLQDLSSFDGHGEGEVAFRSWLFRTTLRKLRDRERYHRRQRRDVAREVASADDTRWDPAHASATPSREAMGAEDREHLHSALARLPDHYREVIRLSYFEELPAAEVGVRMNRSRDAVHSLLARALARLARTLRT